MITGRDLRDIYEAYHVGAITNVRLAFAAGESEIARNRPFRFEWSTASIADAAHNASHIVVFAKDDGETMWRKLTDMRIRDDHGVPRTHIDVTDMRSDSMSDDFSDMYKIVGVTRGDIMQQAGLDEATTLTLTFREADGTTRNVTASYAEGDPTFVVGVAGTSNVNNLRVLSASASPRYCFVNGAVRLFAQVSGIASLLVDGSFPRQSPRERRGADINCDATAGTQSIVVRAVWGGPTTQMDRRITLPIRVHALPTPLRVLAVSVEPTSEFAVTSNTNADADTVDVECDQGTSRGFRWSVVDGVGTTAVWITPIDRWMPSNLWVSGYTGDSATVNCPTRSRIETSLGVIALGADGGGVKLRSGDIQIADEDAFVPPTNVRVLSTTQRRLQVAWDPVSGATDFQARVRRDGAKPAMTDGNATSVWVWAPHAGMEYIVEVRVRNALRAWSAWTPVLATSQAPSLEPPPDVWVSETTSDSITVTWETITGLPFYEVWCCNEMMLPSVNRAGFLWLPPGVPPSQSYTFEGLTTDKEYTVSVRSRSGFDNTSPWVELDPVCIGSCD